MRTHPLLEQQNLLPDLPPLFYCSGWHCNPRPVALCAVVEAATSLRLPHHLTEPVDDSLCVGITHQLPFKVGLVAGWAAVRLPQAFCTEAMAARENVAVRQEIAARSALNGSMEGGRRHRTPLIGEERDSSAGSPSRLVLSLRVRVWFSIEKLGVGSRP